MEEKNSETGDFQSITMLNSSAELSIYKRPLFFLFALILITIFLYFNSLNNAFMFDDGQHVFNRQNLRLKKIDIKSLTGTFYWSPLRKKIYRPIPGLTLGINFYFGGENPFGYHIVNVAIHVLCILAVYYFLMTLLSIPGMKPAMASNYRYKIAVIATCLFALHPLQTNVASYIIQRMTGLVALFYIISVTGYIRFRLGTLPESSQSTAKTIFNFFIFLFSGLSAALSKENAAFLPAIILIIDYLFFLELSPQFIRKKIKIGYGVVIFFLLCVLAYSGPQYYFRFLEGYQSRNFTLIERLMTEARIIFYYLYLIFLPKQNLLNLTHDFSISKNLFYPPQTFFAIIGIIFLLILMVKLRKRYNLFSFVIAWYLGNLIIESTFIPLELIFEHRTYLPGILIYLFMAYNIIFISVRLNKNYIWVVFTALMLVTYSQGIYLRNAAFNNPVSLWLDVVQKAPKLARGYNNLGKAYGERRDCERAKAAFEKALELGPGMINPTINLSIIYLNCYQDITAALELAKKALRINPDDPLSLKTMGDIYIQSKNFKKAEHYYAIGVKNNRFHLETRNILAIVKINLGKKGEAIKIFQDGIRIDPFYENFHLNLAKLYYINNKRSEAIQVLEKYLNINPDSKTAQKRLKLYREKNQHNQCKADEK